MNEMSGHDRVALGPVSGSARIDVLDIIRGFALIGIVLMNVEFFNRSGTELRTFDASLTGLDHTIGWLIRAFVEAKFYTIFALLFGMGFAVMLQRAREAGRPYVGWFIRRMVMLLLIGIAHNYLLWDGDILHDYAFGGLVLLGVVLLFDTRLLRRFNTPRSFLTIGLVLLVYPMLGVTFMGIQMGTQMTHEPLEQAWQRSLAEDAAIQERINDPTFGIQQAAPFVVGELPAKSEADIRQARVDEKARFELQQQARAEREVRIYSEGSYLDGVRYRLSNWKSDIRKTLFFTAVLLLPLFLVGYWFVASGVMRRHREHQRLFASMATIGLVLGCCLTVAATLLQQHPVVRLSRVFGGMGFWLHYAAQLLLAAGYVGLLISILNRPGKHTILGWLAPFGRMALTNYIMQTVILILIFYGYAGGLYGETTRSQQLLIALAIVLAQIVCSAWWLRYFRFGPLEWFWRSATYMSWQPLRR